MKLTEWFSGDVKPVRKGLYQRQYPWLKYPSYSWWNEKEWGHGYKTSESAERMFFSSNMQSLPWRGIAK